MPRSYLVILEGNALTGDPVKMEAYQGANPIEAQIIHGVITGVLYSLKASGIVTIQSTEDGHVFQVDIKECWINGVQLKEKDDNAAGESV